MIVREKYEKRKDNFQLSEDEPVPREVILKKGNTYLFIIILED